MIPNPTIALLIFSILVLLIYLGIKTRVWNRRTKAQRLKAQVEDVLKQLYHVQHSNKKATLNAMAGALKMSDSKLVYLLEHMAGLNLIRLKGQHIYLTESGTDYALKIIRVHRLWEKYLSEETGIDKSEWHQRAEMMEHNLTADQADELYRSLGSPRFDPHGDPIPMKSGEIIESSATPLSGIHPGKYVRITHIEDEPEVIYKQIINEKLHIDQQLKVLSCDDNKTRFLSEGIEYELSTIVASNISVKELNDEESFEAQAVRLSTLKEGEKAKVVGISKECRGANRRRLLDLGFIKGTTIETGLDGPMEEPKAYRIKNTLIALRNDQADLILIEKIAS
ncbi:metal-dependent transcriptional regulator [Marinoscillum sp. MHG1-6]|uniref:metal-dependent transcriptional regulator n=1 Tax=Marinoscillum sp. MHG1-6 TaxID=2959627 RepID=UPI002157D101|nr:metal-dependent transcriptional regulator [Marinoscillum sp. MHG1-6]